MRTKIFLLGLLSLFVFCFASQAARAKRSNIVFIFDCSGSMYKTVRDGAIKTTRFAVAQEAFLKAMKELPTNNPNLYVSLMYYGAKRSCGDDTIKLIAPLARHDTAHRVLLQELVDAMKPGDFGSTPIARSIRKVGKIFKGHEKDVNTVVLITDGEEECEEKTAACKAVEKLSDDGLLTLSFVIGAFLGNQAKDAPPTVRCIGDFKTADNQSAFSKDFKYVMVNSIVPLQLPPPPPSKKGHVGRHVAAVPPPPPPPRVKLPGFLRVDVDAGRYDATWTLLITDSNGKNVTGGGQLMGGGAPQFGRSANRKLPAGKYIVKVTGVGGRDRSPRVCKQEVIIPEGGVKRLKLVLDKCRTGFDMPAFPGGGGFPFK
ncbi:MAG: VWA domain-containing protein [Deltaproteobacteria bacterium]|nr:VWA domain-containing protein [Deltaproteobacteria bacterium]